MKIIEWIKGVKVGTDGYELQEFEKPNGGDVEEKVKSKVLWTGPLNVAGVPTSLNIGEKFSDWDQIIIEANPTSDTDIGNIVENTYSLTQGLAPRNIIIPSWAVISQIITWGYVSDTQFLMGVKTSPGGNISRIIGIKL